jgi:hypothetical protein
MDLRRPAVGAFVIAIPLGILCALALTVIDRPGYSPDEELTAVITGGISQSGAPLLPSGVLYNRGLPYLYLSWIAGVVGGQTLASYRFVSFVCALAGVLLAVRLGTRLGGVSLGVVAAILLASFPAYVAAAVFARPYSALVLAALAFVALFWRARSTDGRHAGALVALALAVLLHPLGAALAALPWIALAAGGRDRTMLRFAIHASVVAAAMVLAGYGAHFLSLTLTGTPFYSGTAIYAIPTASRPPMFSFALVGPWGYTVALAIFAATGAVLVWFAGVNRWIVVLAVVAGLSFQLGLLALAAAIGIILRPADRNDWLKAGLTAAAIAVIWWPEFIAFRIHADPSLTFISGLARSAAVYPFSTLSYTTTVLPALSLLAIAGTASAMRTPRERASGYTRELAVFVLGVLAASSVAGVPLTERYLLLPWTFLVMLSAAGVIACARLAHQAASQRPVLAGSALAAVSCVLVGVAIDGHYKYARERASERSGETVTTAMLAPRTGSWTPAAFRDVVNPGDTVICTEEIACLYLLGRADYLFTLPPQDTEDYVAIRSGQPVGFYASRPVISDEAKLAQVMRGMSSDSCAVVVSLKSGKAGFGSYSAMASRAAGSQFQTLIESEDAFVGRACTSQRDGTPRKG